MAWTIKEIGCILMASGLSERYGRNKLLEPMDGREIILHTAGNLQAAGFTPLAVTRATPEIPSSFPIIVSFKKSVSSRMFCRQIAPY